MNEPRVNPYAAPNSVGTVQPQFGSAGSLGPLWIWLGFAVLMWFCVAMLNPAFMFIALVYGLISFCAGAISTSSLPLLLRMLSLMAWITYTGRLLRASDGLAYGLLWACIGLVSIGMGIWAYRKISDGRVRIFTCFCLGYILGAILLGVIGTVAGATFGALIARRWLQRHATASDGG
jgi:hypothetical protein